MNRCLLPTALVLALGTAAGIAQEWELDPAVVKQVVETANEWAQENLDEDFLKALKQHDRERVQRFLKEFQDSLGGDFVLDLPALKSAALAILPVLEQYDETQPYAAWLRARLDYFDVAEEMRRASPAPPKTPTPAPAQPLPNPTLTVERTVWQREVAKRPLPNSAAALVPKLKPIFESERVPTELVWLAEVESGFDARAQSPVGAAGLFQLMPSTARQYGLRRWPFDQRYQPEPSARAAAQYLRQLHKRFGNWPLALAAYNAGEGTVQRLLDKHKASTLDTIATKLPAETQMFVPKVEATILRREGVKLAELKAP